MPDLLRADEGLEAAEKAIIAYGGIEMSFLEKGMIWISTFITIAPMLGFTGTVQGMIQHSMLLKKLHRFHLQLLLTVFQLHC